MWIVHDTRNLGRQALRRQNFLLDTPSAARFGKSARVLKLIIVKRMWQRNQDRGPAQHRQFGDGRGTRPRDDEVARGHARWQIFEKRCDFGLDAGRAVLRNDFGDVLVARLLHDLQAVSQILR